MAKRRYVFAAAIAITACIQAAVTKSQDEELNEHQFSDPVVADTVPVLGELYTIYESRREDGDVIINWSDPHAGYARDEYQIWDQIWLQALVDWAEHSPYDRRLIERDDWIHGVQVFDANDAQVRQYYLGAAKYCLDHNRDLSAALDLVDKVIVLEPGAYWATYLKARILAKMGDFESATRNAVRCREQAIANNDFDYFKMSEKFIVSMSTVAAKIDQ